MNAIAKCSTLATLIVMLAAPCAAHADVIYDFTGTCTSGTSCGATTAYTGVLHLRDGFTFRDEWCVGSSQYHTPSGRRLADAERTRRDWLAEASVCGPDYDAPGEGVIIGQAKSWPSGRRHPPR
jgi:hypothetical protein